MIYEIEFARTLSSSIFSLYLSQIFSLAENNINPQFIGTINFSEIRNNFFADYSDTFEWNSFMVL